MSKAAKGRRFAVMFPIGKGREGFACTRGGAVAVWDSADAPGAVESADAMGGRVVDLDEWQAQERARRAQGAT